MKGNDVQTKVHLKIMEEDFIIFVESADAVEQWKNDSSVPLAQVVNGWKIFNTHKHGTQGIFDTASNIDLENAFGTSNEEEVVKKILQDGSVQDVGSKERQGDKNITKGPSVAH